MIVVKVARHSITDEETLGTLTVEKDNEVVFTCKTLELPWKNNARRVSCIPTGTYPLVRAKPTKNFPYEHANILNIPGRAGVKIHAGNYVNQILGCILVGSAFHDINGDGLYDVINSKKTLSQLMEHLPESCDIVVT